LTAADRRATRDCCPGFSAAIQAFQRNLTVDQAELLRHLQAMSAALEAATEELSGTGDVRYAEGG
jgi:hypothetical protein